MPACRNHPEVVEHIVDCSRCGGAFCPDCVITLQGRPVCAGCKGEQVKDITSGAVEGLEPAGRGARLGAAIIDTLLLMAVLIPVYMAMGIGSAFFDKEQQTTWFHVITNVLPLILYTFYEVELLKRRGQTVGKMALKIAVLDPAGAPLATAACWKRALTRNLLSITQIGGLIDALMVFTKDRLTIHDRVAKTQVVVWKR
ncbi:MAG: RDD family protein [Planctomycetes bacterium]|nr:RDD family protein [Planctomycetota bacterium]